jgi:hypothetical protein
MDLSFFRGAEERFASRTAAGIDFGMLVAMLQAQQAASPAARAEAACWSLPALPDPLADLILCAPDWRRAVVAQGGSFNPALARQRTVN